MPDNSRASSIGWDVLRLGREQHGFIVGENGFGKTELARRIIEDRFKKRSVVYDPKHSRNISGWKDTGHVFFYSQDAIARNEWAKKRAARIIYRPPLSEIDDVHAQDEIFRWVFERGGTRLYVDECSSLLGESRPSRYFKFCLTQGRELGLSILCATQRPASIPIITMSEASKFYLFHLNMEEDKARMAKITSISDAWQSELNEFEFYFYDARKGVLTWGGFNRRRLETGPYRDEDHERVNTPRKLKLTI